MSKTLKSNIAIVCFFIITSMASFAQTKPGCEPTSCGPDNTKIEEAVAITKLRSDLQLVIDSMKESSVGFNSEITNFIVGKGSSDDESLLFISKAATVARLELLQKTPSSKIIPDLKEYKVMPSLTKQKMVADLKNEIQLLTKQIKAL